jgi:hypothetical protein
MSRIPLIVVVLGLVTTPIHSKELPVPFAITVIDSQTKRGVPLIDLTTTAQVTYTTDSAGRVAFDDDDLLGQAVHFSISGHGYRIKADGFGIRGITLETKAGGSATIEVEKTNLADRLCRLTGQGIYRETERLGLKKPLEIPALRSGVVGCDSVQAAVYGGKIFFFWGDTLRPSYPLGNFHTTGASCELPEKSSKEFEAGFRYQYFEDGKGFVAPVAQMAGEGPTWIFGVCVLKDAQNRESLWAMYTKIKPPLTTYRRGLCKWNEQKHRFEFVKEIPLDFPIWPDGSHVTYHSEKSGDYLYFCEPFPRVRIRATVEAFTDPKTWEAARIDYQTGQLTWVTGEKPSSSREEFRQLREKKLKGEQCFWTPRDRATGEPILLHRGSIRWNEYRQKWILIANQEMGTSALGEVWYAEAESLTGPWREAVKIVTHDRMSFYNPVHHAFLDRDGGRTIYFEGTYTADFSGNPLKTPRYNYNQILYKLDLDKIKN